MKFEEMKVQEFIDELASNSPAPGGGSVAALGGSLGAGLVSMVCNLTIGKEKYKENWTVMEGVLAKSEAIRAKFIDLMISAILAPRFVSIAQVLLSLFVHILQPRCRFVNS